MNPSPTTEEVWIARTLNGANANGDNIQRTVQQIRVQKGNTRATVLNRRETILKRIGDAQNEIGRLNRLLDELRADVLHLVEIE